MKKEDPELEGKNVATKVKEAVEKMKKKPEKCRRKFEEHQKLEEKAYEMWYDGLNDFQKELLEEHRANQLAPEATSDQKKVIRTILEASEERQLEMVTDPDFLPKIEEMFMSSVGQKKRKKTSELERSWGKMMSKEELGAELIAYLNRILKVPQPEKQKKRFLSAFVKKMSKEFGPGHPEKPKPVYNRYTDEMKIENPDLTKQEISGLYKKAQKKRTIGHLLDQFDRDMEDYKDLVKEWVKTLDSEKQKEYAKKYLKGADDLDLDSATTAVEIYDLQPKTPAVYDMPEASDEEPSDRIEELSNEELE